MQEEINLVKSLRLIHDFSDEQVAAFMDKVKTKVLDKKDFLLKSGQKCNFMAFIKTGSIRFYMLTEDSDQTLYFFTENSWIADYESFISQQASKNNLQAIEKTELIIISLDDIHQLMELYPVFRNLASVMGRWTIASSHLASLVNSSPDERYKNLLETNPDWINRFPQMYIASYLGITQETLSRVKKRIR